MSVIFVQVLFYRNLENAREIVPDLDKHPTWFMALADGFKSAKTREKSVFFFVFRSFFGLFPANIKKGQICMEWAFLGKTPPVGPRNHFQLFPAFAHFLAMDFQEFQL